MFSRYLPCLLQSLITSSSLFGYITMDFLTVRERENGNIADMDGGRYSMESTVSDNGAGQGQSDVDNTTRKIVIQETVKDAPESCRTSKETSNSSTPKNAWENSSYADLITQAIMSSSDKRMTLQEIYAWFSDNIQYFMDKRDSPTTTGWKNSVRHTLSIRKRFIRARNTEYGSLNYKSHWMIDPNEETRKRGRSQRSARDSSLRHNQSRLAGFCCPYCGEQNRLGLALSYQNGLGYY